jgi:hypothetical protein
MQTATNGFRQTGIYPLNRNIFLEHIFAPSLTTDRPTPEPNLKKYSGNSKESSQPASRLYKQGSFHTCSKRS